MHVYGNYNNYVTDETTKMKWNENSGRYSHPMLLKQGFYNYKFVIVEEDGSIDQSIQPSGNYWQTENEYQILVYYRFPGGRFDELLGYGTTNSTGITN